jgi:glycosyltransferase involved in cell wall biosynthesis
VKCSIVIRSYNEESHIGRLLTGITRQTVQDVEIVLVDSGSTDATVSIASRFPVKIVSIAPAEFTFGRSLNRGIAATTGDIIVLASAHVYPEYDDWLESMLAPFADPRIALVYGKQRGNATTKYSEERVFRKWFPEESNLEQDHPFCNNANAAIRRSVWEQMPYDEALTGLEDLAWAKELIERGHKLAYVARAEIIHVHDETPSKIFNRYRREAIAMKHIFPNERFHFSDFVRLLAGNIASDLRSAARDRVLRKQFADIIRFRAMQFWGTYRGFAMSSEPDRRLMAKFYYPNDPRVAEASPRDDMKGRRIEYAEPVKGKRVV